MGLSVFGIRHHGPGSARSLRAALESLEPEILLVEGPGDAQDALPLIAHPQMEPPVALLLYIPDEPNRSVFYPYTVFSPEWQALTYAFSRNIPARLIDLPQAHQLALPAPEPPPPQESGGEGATGPGAVLAADPRQDPLTWIAHAAGYSDGERWWENQVEQRRESADLFQAVLELMFSLRQAVEAESTLPPDPAEALREAHMRQSIRAAQEDGFKTVAVVCGAWHAPVLARLPSPKEDAALLKGLPKVKVAATWVPWTYGRLTRESGYGAGIDAPGWYHHLWSARQRVAVGWMAKASRLLRDEDLPGSPAHVIEAVRLAEALAAMRDRPLPGLPELTEAVRTVFCSGSDAPIRLIHDRLIIGDRIGKVPEETPMLPLQRDVEREQKRLRLPPEALARDIDLDLRKPGNLERSYLLHRLNLLGIPWGAPTETYGAKGTFHELWRLQWTPEMAVSLIEASVWGNTVREAATARAQHLADGVAELAPLTALTQSVLWADLPEALGPLMARLQSLAAVTSDIPALMESLPGFAQILRYGNVRQTDTGMVAHVVDGIVARIAIGLPAACASLNDEAAEAMFARLIGVHQAIHLLQNEGHLAVWNRALESLADMPRLHALLAGRCCRLLLEYNVWSAEETARRMGLALSLTVDPAMAAAWVEGFLRGSGLLLHNDILWNILDGWVSSLPGEAFNRLLPLLRRTFATFPAPERRQMGERAKKGPERGGGLTGGAGEVDTERADQVLPLIARLLGVEMEPQK